MYFATLLFLYDVFSNLISFYELQQTFKKTSYNACWKRSLLLSVSEIKIKRNFCKLISSYYKIEKRDQVISLHLSFIMTFVPLPLNVLISRYQSVEQ